MSKLFPDSYRATAALAAVPLVLCSLIPWFARADGSASAAVGVVDAFDNARVARDVNAVAGLLDANASVVDSSSSGDRATGTEGLYQLLPLGETVEFGPRTQTEAGEVTWTETVVQTGRPSWENNPNWWMDGNDALQAEPPMPDMGAPPATSGPQTGESGPAATNDTRVMLAIVTQGRIMRLTMTPVASLEASIPTSNAVALRSGGARIARLLALVSPLALVACVLVAIVCFEPTVRPASNRGWLLYGLKGWLAARQRQGPC